jgi:hypothetical protein
MTWRGYAQKGAFVLELLEIRFDLRGHEAAALVE